MADKRIKDLATTAITPATGDYLVMDGATNGTRKIDANLFAIDDELPLTASFIYDSSYAVVAMIYGDIPNNFASFLSSGSTVIGTSVTSIGNYGFSDNLEVTSVLIPTSVTSIGNYAFAYSTSLAEVDCYVPLTAFTGSDAFYGTASPLTIHARSTDASWTAGTGLSIQGNTNVTVIKDL